MITVYSKLNCPNCQLAKVALIQAGVPYTEVLLATPGDLAVFKAQYPSVKAVPFTLGPTGVIGGLSELKTWLQGRV